jgi:hypothetical protein
LANAVVLERGGKVYLVRPAPARLVAFSLSPVRAAGREGLPDRLPVNLVSTLEAISPEPGIRTDTEGVASELRRRLRCAAALASVAELRHARSALPPTDPSEERLFALGVAKEALERALRTPEEVLITLTREEERVERAVGREARAAESFLVVPGSALAEYASRWTGVRVSLDRHHEEILGLVRTHARSVVPNLSAVVGERSAARLVSAAGGVTPLSRMRAGRIQLLGTRRRPSPERGPRYGILYRADRMADVPAGRRGAYARSLGALAAIAVRADATTHATISKELLARRDRRIDQLRKRRP